MSSSTETFLLTRQFMHQVREERDRRDALRAEVSAKQRTLAELDAQVEAKIAEARQMAVRTRAYVYVIRLAGGVERAYEDSAFAEEAWAHAAVAAGGEDALIRAGGMPAERRILTPDDVSNFVDTQ